MLAYPVAQTEEYAIQVVLRCYAVACAGKRHNQVVLGVVRTALDENRSVGWDITANLLVIGIAAIVVDGRDDKCSHTA